MNPFVYILIGIAVLFATFAAVVIVRTLKFKPKVQLKPLDNEEIFDTDRAISNLQTLIKCKTVSFYTREGENEGEFQKLISSLPNLYPEVFRVCEYRELKDRALLFKWEGKEHNSPAVLMAHYDVVPADEAKWDKPPFDAVIEDGVLWGRGTLDTKVTFNSILTSANHLIEQGFVPENDIYFAFSGGEEVNGEGAIRIVEYFEENGINPAFILDEGGAVVENVFPGVKAPCGLVGIAEKGMIDLEYTVKSRGGHASAPPPHTPVGVLAKACVKVEKTPFKNHLTKPVLEMFDTLGRHSTFLYRMIFANMWCFGGLLDLICKKSGGELNALVRTTVAFTQMQGSSTTNVIPPEARMVSNMRLNPMDTVDSAIEYIRKTVDDGDVVLNKIRGTNPSPISETKCEVYDRISKAIVSTWKGAIVSPYLMMQCSDSRHWGRLSKYVYRFSSMDLTKEERQTIHGNNERIRLDCLKKSVEFYIRLMRMC